MYYLSCLVFLFLIIFFLQLSVHRKSFLQLGYLTAMFLLLFFFLPESAHAATTMYVRTNGDDITCSGLVDAPPISPPDCAYLSMTKAMTVAIADDIVNVAAGEYAEDVTINVNIKLVGTGSPTATSFTLTNTATLVAGTTGISSATVNVDQTGGAGAKIADALTLVSAEGTINIAAGAYGEDITINKNIKLVGTGDPTTTSFTLTNGATLVSGTTGITAATINVDQVGATGAKIADALTLVAAGGTINAGAGTYAEDVTINKSAQLVGTGSPTATSFTLTNGAVLVAGTTGITAATVNVNQTDAAGALVSDALTLVADNGTINVASGTYADNFTVTKPVTIKGNGAANTTIQRAATGGATVIVNYAGTADNQVILDSMTLSPPSSGAAAGDWPVQITTGTNYLTIKNCIINSTGEPTAGISLEGAYDHLTINNNTLNYDSTGLDVALNFNPTATDGVTSNLSLTNNTFTATGDVHYAIKFASLQTAAISGNTFGSGVRLYLVDGGNDTSAVTVTSNKFTPSDTSTSHWGGLLIIPKSNDGVTKLTSLTVSNNGFVSNDFGLAFVTTLTADRITLGGITVNNNNFAGNDTGSAPYDKAVVVAYDPSPATLNAENNWWNSATGPNTDGDSVSDYVDYDPYYTDVNRTVLSNGSYTDSTLLSSSAGQVQMPNSITAISLNKTNNLDTSAGLSTASGGNVYIGGGLMALGNYTYNDLTAQNLSGAITIGDTSMTVNKVVRLDSGITGTGVTVSTLNSAPEVTVSIPDGTVIMGPSGWDGKFQPPVIYTAPSTDSIPSGYTLGDHVTSLGSTSVELLFDKAISIIIKGASGAIGYKPVGSSSWVRITNACSGTYDNPTAPTFPGECFISNSTDTKIHTYHLSYFASLDSTSNTYSSGSSESTDNTKCQQPKPLGHPDLFQINMKKNSATLYYTTVKENMNTYFIIYGFKPGDERYAMSFAANPGNGHVWSIDIKKLVAGKTYYFKMRAGNGCAPGEWSSWLGGKTPYSSYATYKYMKYTKKK